MFSFSNSKYFFSLFSGLFHRFIYFRYFTCFDQNREELLAAYHRKAIFSISINSNSKAAQTGPKFGEYFTSSRNLLHVTTTDKCHKMLHIGNIDIVAFINKFPTTEHNFDSFKLDISYFTVNIKFIHVRFYECLMTNVD